MIVSPLIAAGKAPLDTSPGVAFSFTAKKAGRSSAGVFLKDGTLIRTLWSGIPTTVGTFNTRWDGRDDQGRLVADGNYDIKVLANAVTYTWEGVIGNSSQNPTGESVHRHWNPINSMVIVGQNAYYASAYQEGNMPLNKFALSQPQVNQPLPMFRGDNGVTLCTADNNRIYWANDDPFSALNFVFATTVDSERPVTFPKGAPASLRYGPDYPSAIDANNQNTNGAVSGMAVQPNGNLLLIAHRGLNEIHILDKTSGQALKTINTLTAPRHLALQDQALWVVSATNTLQKFTLKPDGNLSAPLLSIAGLSDPLAIDVSPDGRTLIVVDAGTSQQLKAFDTQTGKPTWTLGQAGGYTQSAAVATDKFFFTSAVSDYKYSFVCFQNDGSFWLGDTQNRRAMHFSASRAYLEQISYLPRPYTCVVDPNDPTRVFQGYLEFKVDYSKPLAPNNGSWKLVANWGSVPSKYDDHYEMTNVVTLSNGRTYGRQRNTSTSKGEIWELMPQGILRNTGVVMPSLATLVGADGHMRRVLVTDGRQRWKIRRLTGFDANDNPTYGPEQDEVTTPDIQGTAPTAGGTQFSPGAITKGGLYVSFDGDAAHGQKYYLGAVQQGQTSWKWKTAFATHSEYAGSFPADGRFEIGNGMGPDHGYGGSVALTLGGNIFWGYHGEFWKNSQTNKWNHVYENGLFVGQFGVTRPETNGETAASGMGGNALYANVVQVNGVAYLYHGEECDHSGLHRWRIDGLNSITEQTIPVKFSGVSGGLTDYYFGSEDLNNMLLETNDAQKESATQWTTSDVTLTSKAATPYSVRWQGFVKTAYSEPYKVYLKTATGVRLWFDEKLVIDQWNNKSNTEFKSPDLDLDADQQYTIRLESKGNTTVALSWSSRSQPKSAIPTQALSPATPNDSISIDLHNGLPFNKVLADNMYGWKRNPVQENYNDPYSNWWQVATNKKTYRPESPDVYVKYRQAAGQYTVTRDLGNVENANSWTLSGRVSFEDNEGNSTDGKAGCYLDVLDKRGKVIARTYVMMDYNGRFMSLYGNKTALIRAQEEVMRPFLDKLMPVSISGSSAGITIFYADDVKVTTSVFETGADWRSPKTLRLLFFTNGGRNSDRSMTVQGMSFQTEKGSARIASAEALADSTPTKLSIYPNPCSSYLQVEHDSLVGGGGLSIFSIDGKQVKTHELGTGSKTATVDIRTLPTGTYMLQYGNGITKTMAHFIKQ